MKYMFRNDYSFGAHPKVLEAVCAVNLEGNWGYGDDGYTAKAKDRIREVCGCPDAMVEFEADNLVNDMAQRIQAQGIPFEQYMAMTGMTMDIMREQAKAAALERVRRDLALNAVVAAENIQVSDEELEEEYKKLAEQYHMELDKVKQAVAADDIRKELSLKKAEQVIYDSAKVGKAPAKKKTTKKKAEDAEAGEAAEGEEKPKKRRTTKKKESEEGEEKPAEEKTEE